MGRGILIFLRNLILSFPVPFIFMGLLFRGVFQNIIRNSINGPLQAGEVGDSVGQYQECFLELIPTCFKPNLQNLKALGPRISLNSWLWRKAFFRSASAFR